MNAAVDSYPLSPTQAGMLYHAIKEASTGIDIEQIVIRLDERLDETAFMQAWQAIARRHAILRTRFCWEGVAEFRQEVVATIEIPLETVDWSALAPAESQARLDEQLAADRLRNFDLTHAPVMRMFIAKLGDEAFRIVWTFHHALLDGRSFARVVAEVFAQYDALLRGDDARLGEPSAYRDYIRWRDSLDLHPAETHWREHLVGFHTATPFGIPPPAAASRAPGSERPAFGARQRRISRETTSALRSRAIELDVTLNTLLMASWAILLHRYSGESDIVFGTTRAGRSPVLDSGKVDVGLFINTVPVRVDVAGELELVPWLTEFRRSLVRMRPFEHAPLVKVQSWSSVGRGKPLFESLVVFDHQSLDARLRATAGRWQTRSFEYIGQTSYPLAVVAYGDDEMLVRLEYARQRFSDVAIERMLGHLTTLLAGLARDDVKQLRDLAMLGEGERAALLGADRRVQAHPRGPTLHALFEAQVARTPDAIALTAFAADSSRVELSYGELNRRANALAHRLRSLGVVPNQLVGLRTERDADLVIAILGILKSGGAYLPLDPVYPRERVAFMLADSGVRVLLTQTSRRGELDGIREVFLDEPVDADAATDAERNPAPASTADDLAYVIYTSGSTGAPKGAQVTHHNVTRLFATTEDWYRFDAHDVWTLFHSYAFDFSVWEMWGALLYGGRVVVVPLDVARSIEDFQELLVRERVTVLNQTPTAFRRLTGAIRDRAAPRFALRYVIFGGEALEVQSLKGWFDRYGDERPRLVNMYGITETTVHVSYRPIRRADLEGGAGSVIGVPLPDLRVYLLDPHGEPVPIGVTGEMFVAGAGVGLGYLNRPELTAHRFLRDPFAADPDARMYRTGDLARRLDDGDIEYLGRIDQQVKIRGFRIELGEIEAAIAQDARVRQVAVIAREDNTGDRRLVAYLVSDADSAELVEQLRNALRRQLPDYMVPAHFVPIPVLPLTQNGKLDRNALPAPTALAADRARPHVAPRNAVEATIAAVWQAVLRVDRVSVDDHFFELGGDSILSIQVIARCRQHGLKLTPRDIFAWPTVAELAEVVRVATAAVPSVSAPIDGEVALTPIQRWFFAQELVDVQHWNQAFLFEVPADFSTSALATAVRGLVAHHDALRLRYRRGDDGEWTQRYESDDAAGVAVAIDLSTVAAAELPAAIERHSSAVQVSFRLAEGPLLRAVHFRLGEGMHGRLLLAAHHLVVDGVSWRLLREDLETLYIAAAIGRPAALPAKTSSLQEWARALQEHAQRPQVLRSLDHWRAIAATPPLVLPGLADAVVGDGGTVTARLSRDETRALLQRLPAVFESQINDVLLTALCRALQRWTGAATLRIDLEGHGREHVSDAIDVSRTVGWFTSLYPVALRVDPAADAPATVASIREQLRLVPDRGFSHGLLRYVADEPAVREALAAAPASPVLFNYLGQFDAVVADSAIFSFARESTGAWRSARARRAYPLEVVAMVRDGELEIGWHHAADRSGKEAMERVARDTMAVLRELIAAAETTPRQRARSAVESAFAGLDVAALALLRARYPALEDAYPLTPMQRLFLAMEASQAGLGLEQWHFRLDGRLDAALLRRAIEAVVERHAILRTAVVSEGVSEPLQVVSFEAALPWSEEDWRALTAAEQSERLEQLLSEDASAAFELAKAPLMRVALRRIGDELHHLIWTTHHLCIDGWSWPVVFADVSRSYAALASGRAPFPRPALQFRRYVDWLARSAPDSEGFWKAQLAGFAAPTPLPAGTPTGAPRGGESPGEPFDEIVVTLPAATTGRLLAVAKRLRVTPSTILGSAWALLLAHYSDATGVVYGASFSGRPAEIDGIEHMVGPCVNNLPVRVAVDRAARLGSWLVDVQQLQFALAEHQHASLEQIQRWSGIPWRLRLFESLVVFQNYQVDTAARTIGADVRSTLLRAPEATNYPLTLAVSVGDELRLRFLFKPGRFARATVSQFGEDLTTALAALCELATLEAPTVGDVASLLPASSRGSARAAPLARPSQRNDIVLPPASQLELEVAAVWQDLFGIEQISVEDNFFDLGGHSLLLVQAHARLQDRLRRSLPIVALLQYPTVRSLAHHLNGGSAGDAAATTAAERARRQREAQARQRTLAGRRPS